MTNPFKRGDMVRHKDGRVGMVERCTGPKVTVQFPGHWRSSVCNARNLALSSEDTA